MMQAIIVLFRAFTRFTSSRRLEFGNIQGHFGFVFELSLEDVRPGSHILGFIWLLVRENRKHKETQETQELSLRC